MSSGKKTSVNVPSFTKPAVPSFNIPGYGASTYANDVYGLTLDPSQADYQNQLKTLRTSLLSELGITSPQREASLNAWGDAFTKEALRTSMPQLEQTLFARGLGGSEFYKGAVGDLLSKVATQATLQREQLRQQDEMTKLQQLASIAGLSQQEFANMLALTGASQSAGLSEESLSGSRWASTLPYLATVTTKDSGLSGALSGAIQGASAGMMTGNPWGALIGAGIGAGTGYAGSAGTTTQPYQAVYGKGNTDGGSNDLQWLTYLAKLQSMGSSSTGSKGW